MTDRESLPSRLSSIGVPLGVALLGFSAQVLWFSTQFGGITARIEEQERRVAVIEQVGSPALSGVHAQVEELQRRVTSIEQGGSPALQANRTQIDVNTRRLNELDQSLPATMLKLSTTSATQDQLVVQLGREVERLRDWQRRQVEEDAADAARDAVQDKALGSLAEQVARLQEQFQQHKAGDLDAAISLSALRQAQLSLQDQINHLRDINDRILLRRAEPLPP